jgi:HEAT repeat protein
MEEKPASRAQFDEWIQSQDWELRRAAIKVVHANQWVDVIPLLIELVREDEVAAIRSTAAKELGRLSASEAIPVLCEAAQDPVNTVRGASIRALGKLRAFDALSVLHEACSDRDWHIQAAAVRALGKLLRPESLSYLMPMLDHEQEIVRNAASNVLEKYGLPKDLEETKLLQTALSDAPIDDLASLEWTVQESLLVRLFSHEERVAERASKALGRSRNKRVLPYLMQAMSWEPKTAFDAATLISSAEPEERFALLRSVLDGRFLPAHVWSVLCHLMNQWPEDQRELVLSYLEGHLTSWPDHVRMMTFVKATELAPGRFPAIWPLVKALRLYSYGNFSVPLVDAILGLDKADMPALHRVTLGHSFVEDQLALAARLLRGLPLEQMTCLESQCTIKTVSYLDWLADQLSQRPNCRELLCYIGGLQGLLPKVAGHDCLPYIKTLQIMDLWDEQSVTLEGLLEVLSSPKATQLEELAIYSAWGTWSSRQYNVRELLKMLDEPGWERLKSLSLHRCFAHQDGLATFFASPRLQGLESLAISVDEHAHAEAVLESVTAEGAYPDLQTFRLDTNELRPPMLRRLAQWPQLAKLKKLSLPVSSRLHMEKNGLSLFEVLAFLEEAPFSASLQQLSLPRFFGEEALQLRQAIARHPVLSGVILL